MNTYNHPIKNNNTFAYNLDNEKGYIVNPPSHISSKKEFSAAQLPSQSSMQALNHQKYPENTITSHFPSHQQPQQYAPMDSHYSDSQHRLAMKFNSQTPEEQAQNTINCQPQQPSFSHCLPGEKQFSQAKLVQFLGSFYLLLLLQSLVVLSSSFAINYFFLDILSDITSSYTWILYIIISIAVVITFLAFQFRTYWSISPYNYTALVIQTLGMIGLALLCMSKFSNSIVFLTLIAICSVYMSLLVYVLISKSELNIKNSLLFLACSAVFIYQLFLIFTTLSALSSLFVLLVLILWGTFILYHTQTRISNLEQLTKDTVISVVTLIPDIIALGLKVTDLLRQAALQENY